MDSSSKRIETIDSAFAAEFLKNIQEEIEPFTLHARLCYTTDTTMKIGVADGGAPPPHKAPLPVSSHPPRPPVIDHHSTEQSSTFSQIPLTIEEATVGGNKYTETCAAKVAGQIKAPVQQQQGHEHMMTSMGSPLKFSTDFLNSPILFGNNNNNDRPSRSSRRTINFERFPREEIHSPTKRFNNVPAASGELPGEMLLSKWFYETEFSIPSFPIGATGAVEPLQFDDQMLGDRMFDGQMPLPLRLFEFSLDSPTTTKHLANSVSLPQSFSNLPLKKAGSGRRKRRRVLSSSSDDDAAIIMAGASGGSILVEATQSACSMLPRSEKSSDSKVRNVRVFDAKDLSVPLSNYPTGGFEVEIPPTQSTVMEDIVGGSEWIMGGNPFLLLQSFPDTPPLLHQASWGPEQPEMSSNQELDHSPREEKGGCSDVLEKKAYSDLLEKEVYSDLPGKKARSSLSEKKAYSNLSAKKAYSNLSAKKAYSDLPEKKAYSDLFSSRSQQTPRDHNILVWAKWRSNQYCIGYRLKRASRTRDLWQVRFMHWRPDRVTTLASDDIKPANRSLCAGDAVSIVQDRKKKCLLPARFMAWKENEAVVLVDGVKDTAPWKDLLIDRVVFTLVGKEDGLEMGGNDSERSRDERRDERLQDERRDERRGERQIERPPQAAASSSPNVGDKQKKANNILKGVSVVFTFGDNKRVTESAKKKLREQILDQGGMLIESIDSKDMSTLPVLMTCGYCRTAKFFTGLILGVPIVTKEWLIDSIKKQELLPFEEYAVELPENAKKCRRSRRELLWGAKLYLEGKNKFKQTWRVACEAAGGMVLESFKDLKGQPDGLFIVEELSLCTNRNYRFAKEHGIKIHTIEWLINLLLFGTQ